MQSNKNYVDGVKFVRNFLFMAITSGPLDLDMFSFV
jgi:hypothetical protein